MTTNVLVHWNMVVVVVELRYSMLVTCWCLVLAQLPAALTKSLGPSASRREGEVHKFSWFLREYRALNSIPRSSSVLANASIVGTDPLFMSAGTII